jgi:hypothetical protein
MYKNSTRDRTIFSGPIIRRFEDDSAIGLPDGIFTNQKYQFWVKFGGPYNGRCWYVLWTFGIY